MASLRNNLIDNLVDDGITLPTTVYHRQKTTLQYVAQYWIPIVISLFIIQITIVSMCQKTSQNIDL